VADIGLFFGSDEGNTEGVAFRIEQCLGEENVDVLDIGEATQLDFAAYDKLIMGIPTWDFGQLQSDWDDFWNDLIEIDFTGKTVALFGLGDQFGYGDFFLDAMGMLHEVIVKRGATIVGHWPIEGYEFDASKAKVEGEDAFVGLALDEDQQPELTNPRIEKWCQKIVDEFNLDITIKRL